MATAFTIRSASVPEVSASPIPLTKPFIGDLELNAVRKVLASGKLDGDGPYSQRAERLLQELTGAPLALVTASGSAALEMAALLLNLAPGDEVIMPSFTFPSTANAVVLRGAVPVFVDITSDTFNLDPNKIESALSGRTKAIIPVHYAGVGCRMNEVGDIAGRRQLRVIEDAAHAVGAELDGRPLGTFGDLGAYSFHASKNLVAGEGGALIVNDPDLCERAEIILEKGTSRRGLMRGNVSKYCWTDVGSSYVPSELTAALLSVQLVRMKEIQRRRLAAWQRYANHPILGALVEDHLVSLPVIPSNCRHNAHLFVILLNSPLDRDRVSARFARHQIQAWRHYVPLHSSPAGRRFGRTPLDCSVTENVAERLLRLPLFPELTFWEQDRILNILEDELRD
jgi:dTDP-4-amino-4,6-dideoxygalactose transaminase